MGSMLWVVISASDVQGASGEQDCNGVGETVQIPPVAHLGSCARSRLPRRMIVRLLQSPLKAECDSDLDPKQVRARFLHPTKGGRLGACRLNQATCQH